MESKRNTVQRQLIFAAVKELGKHAAAEQVYDYITLKHPSIGRATVYRNLSRMAEAGELLSIGTFYGATHYDHQVHQHYHIICDECREIFDIEGDFSDLNERIKGAAGFDFIRCNISFSGLCQKCQQKA
jgi:Fe2+ or Zn2+ uptake regulation protein